MSIGIYDEIWLDISIEWYIYIWWFPEMGDTPSNLNEMGD